MEDQELLTRIGLGYRETAAMIKVTYQVLQRSLSREPKSGARRGSVTKKYYLNTDRLLAIWKSLLTSGDVSSAEIVRQELIARQPLLTTVVSPYAQEMGDPDTVQFSEAWIFSRAPLETKSLEFQAKMRDALRDKNRRIVYFVPSAAEATELLWILQRVADNALKEVFIVTTRAVLIAPHWFVLFTDGKEGRTKISGIFPQEHGKPEQWSQVARLGGDMSENIVRTLSNAGLLDQHQQFKPPAYGFVDEHARFHPSFQLFYPKAA